MEQNKHSLKHLKLWVTTSRGTWEGRGRTDLEVNQNHALKYVDVPVLNLVYVYIKLSFK